MFPHPCGEELRNRVAAGADPKAVVPDAYLVVRGGTKPAPNPGTAFSCNCGPDLAAAGCGVPHGQIRFASIREIREKGGSVIWLPEHSHRGTLNLQHVNVTESVVTSFGEPVPNPVMKVYRIDQGR